MYDERGLRLIYEVSVCDEKIKLREDLREKLEGIKGKLIWGDLWEGIA